MLRVSITTLEGVYDTLKEHYAMVWDFGFKILKNNPCNSVDVRTIRVTSESDNKFKIIYIYYYALKIG